MTTRDGTSDAADGREGRAKSGGGASLTFRSRQRLTHAREFEAVYAAKVRKQRGPLMVFTRPNGLDHHRLGLAVGARVGGAVVRNRIKRLLREAFRLQQNDLARAADGTAYDVVVSVRAGAGAGTVGVEEGKGPRPPTLAGCMTMLRELVAEGDAEWRRRARRESTP